MAHRSIVLAVTIVSGLTVAPISHAAAQDAAAAEAPAEAAPAAAPADDLTAQLEALAKLKEQGILTDEEFAAKKAQILGI